MSVIKIASISPDDPNFNKESGLVDVNLEVQCFDENYSGLENIEDVNDKTISYHEKLIRNSFEYKEYIGYLKNELDITSCAITPSLNIKDFNFGLEFHHHPFTLYDIVNIILNEKLAKKPVDGKVSMFDVMSDVMNEHYKGNVGLVPLSKTAHEMYHNDSLVIPGSAIYGNYRKFIAEHKPYISQDVLDKVNTLSIITQEEAADFNTKFTKTPLKYNIKYNRNDNKEEE